MPKVSVIIPTYNALAYLPATIESVLNQTFSDFEVLIVDDGSSDDTAAWAAQLSDSRIRYFSQPNQGCAVARNTGLTHAQGEYIAFLDSDDLWDPTKLAKQVDCLDANPAVGLVNTWVMNADEQGNPTDQVLQTEAEGDVWKQIAEESIVFCGSVPLVRRACFATVGQFDTTLTSAEDWDMWIRIAARYPFAVVKEPLVFYRQRSSSKSNNHYRHLQYRLQVIDKTFEAAPPSLQPIKQKAYGRAHLSVAWKPLINNDYETALQLRRQALTYYPQLRYTRSYFRLGAIITTRRWLGQQGYQRARTLLHILRNPQTILGFR